MDYSEIAIKSFPFWNSFFALFKVIVILPVTFLILFPLFLWLRPRSNKISIVLGSGGHTSEMLRMIQNSGRPLNSFTFWIGKDDKASKKKISVGEKEHPS